MHDKIENDTEIVSVASYHLQYNVHPSKTEFKLDIRE